MAMVTRQTKYIFHLLKVFHFFVIIIVHVSFVLSMVKDCLSLDGAGHKVIRQTKFIHSHFMPHLIDFKYFQLLLFTILSSLAQKKS